MKKCVLIVSDIGAKWELICFSGSLGQLGSGLARLLRQKYGRENVLMSDIRKPSGEILNRGPYLFADVLDVKCIEQIVVNYRIDWIVHFSALLSAVAEANVPLSMKVNIEGMWQLQCYNILA